MAIKVLKEAYKIIRENRSSLVQDFEQKRDDTLRKIEELQNQKDRIQNEIARLRKDLAWYDAAYHNELANEKL